MKDDLNPKSEEQEGSDQLSESELDEVSGGTQESLLLSSSSSFPSFGRTIDSKLNLDDGGLSSSDSTSPLDDSDVTA